jgi:hypothetical protein
MRAETLKVQSWIPATEPTREVSDMPHIYCKHISRPFLCCGSSLFVSSRGLQEVTLNRVIDPVVPSGTIAARFERNTRAGYRR